MWRGAARMEPASEEAGAKPPGSPPFSAEEAALEVRWGPAGTHATRSGASAGYPVSRPVPTGPGSPRPGSALCSLREQGRSNGGRKGGRRAVVRVKAAGGCGGRGKAALVLQRIAGTEPLVDSDDI